jgi:hypothetical protein
LGAALSDEHQSGFVKRAQAIGIKPTFPDHGIRKEANRKALKKWARSDESVPHKQKVVRFHFITLMRDM